MKRVLNAKVGGIVISIEDDALMTLEAYLSEVRDYFATLDAGDEIVTDIEVSIAEKCEELKAKKPKSAQSITKADVEQMIAQLGTVQDFAQEAEAGGEGEQGQGSNRGEARSVHLYRDVDNAILGGVAGGIAHYFDIDPVFVRLAFMASIFMGGTGVLAYIVLWIVMPAAQTASQKLQMHGQHVDLDAIRDKVNNAMERLEKRDNESWRKIFTFPILLAKMLGTGLKRIVPVLRSLFGIGLMMLTTVLSIAITVSASVFIFGDVSVQFDPMMAQAYDEFMQGYNVIATVLAVYTVLLLPILAFFFAGVLLFFRKKMLNTWVILLMILTWVVALSYTSVQVIRAVPRVEHLVQAVSNEVAVGNHFITIEHQQIPFGRGKYLVGGDAVPTTGEENVMIKAVGTEPFWSFEYADGELVWSAPSTEGMGEIIHTQYDVGFAKVERQITLRGLGESDMSTILISEVCSDGMSDRVYTHSVRATALGTQYNGCATITE